MLPPAAVVKAISQVSGALTVTLLAPSVVVSGEQPPKALNAT